MYFMLIVRVEVPSEKAQGSSFKEVEEDIH